LDSDDSDEVGGSLLSLASPSSSASNNLFINPVQDQINNINVVAKLAEENGIQSIYFKY